MTTPTSAKPHNPQHPVPDRFPELVFGLIGPAGTDLKIVFKMLRKTLLDLGYNVPKQVIRLSKLVEEFLEKDFSNLSEDKRVASV